MQLPFHIIQLLKRKLGSDLRIPSDCEILSLDIESKTGVRIGATTLKRLLGFAQDERTPHTSTLDAIARYLGYAHWDELLKIEDSGNSDFDTPDDEVRSDDLQPGARLEITYLPDRKLTLEYLSNNRYRVTDNENSKLQKGEVEYRIDEYGIGYSLDGHRLLFARYTFKDSEYHVPDGVVTICSMDFATCRQFVTLYVPRSVRLIGDFLFGPGGGKIVL